MPDDGADTDVDADAEVDALVARLTRQLTLPAGDHVLVRPLLRSDREELEAGFDQLSPESRYFRFFSHLDHLSARQLGYLTELDYDDHFALAAFSLDEPSSPGIGVARYVRDEHANRSAELAVAVLDDYHGRGVGVALIRELAAIAVEHDIDRFVAYFLRENTAMREVFEFLGAGLRAAEPGVVRATLPLPLPADGNGEPGDPGSGPADT